MNSFTRRQRFTIRLGAVLLALVTVFAVRPERGCATTAEGNLRCWMDYAAFRLHPAEPNGYVEFYFEMKRVDFEFRLVDNLLRAEVYTWVHVSDTLGRDVDSVGGAFVSVVADSTELADSNFTLFFARALILPPGEYSVHTLVADLANRATAEAMLSVSVPDFSSSQLLLSGIEFAYDVIDKSGDTLATHVDILVKNGQKVYPDCRGLISASRPRLMFYSEVYNLDFDPARDNQYTMDLWAIPTDRTPPRALQTQTPTKPGADAVLATGVNVRDLPPGDYYLKIDVTDPATEQTASTQKLFHVVAPRIDSITPDEAEQIRNIISYIARPEELATFERLNAVGKNSFWKQFWKDRDPTPGTVENESKDEHMRRMNYANERFSVGFDDRTDGWRTDMGRVYIIYGPPDYVERYPFTPERPAAEQWFYDHLTGQGQVYFLFVDEAGYGEYNLVHSTARGERRDPYWEEKIREGAFDRTQ